MQQVKKSPILSGVIIGAQKAGTSTVLSALMHHPMIHGHRTIEMSFFLLDAEYMKGWEVAVRRHYGRLDHRALFAKNVGLLYSALALERLRCHSPNVQIFIFLRDPVSRAYSSFNFARQRGWEPLVEFGAALDAGPERFGANEMARRNCDYIGRSMYAKHLEHVHRLFPSERIHVYLDSDIGADTPRLLRSMLEAMALKTPAGWDPDLISENVASRPRSSMLARVLGGSGGAARSMIKLLVPPTLRDGLRRTLITANREPFLPPPLDAAVEARLRELFRAPNRALERIIGRDLSGWGT